tara:strand:+ start:854 stop:1252 length:399 start_codon:yes stop_codon:yes gene_type:complete
MEVELSFERDVRMTVNTTVELDVAAMKRWWQDDNLDEPLPEGWPNKHHIEAYVRFCDDFANVPLITPRLAGDHNLDKEIAAILFDGEDVIYSKDNVGTPDDWLITVGWIHTYPWLSAEEGDEEDYEEDDEDE